MKLISIIFTAVPFSLAESSFAQDFTNLNFEDTTVIPAYPPGTVNFYATSVAIPGWTAYLGGVVQSTIPNDGVSTGGAMVSLQDTNALSYGAIQGNFSVLLVGPTSSSGIGNPTNASIGQTGTIPITAQSLMFWGSQYNGTLQVTFNGQTLSLMDISNALNYTIWGANVSAYAGETGQLLFTAIDDIPFASGGLLDNIQFSSLPIPEPSEFALAALGALFLGFRRRWR